MGRPANRQSRSVGNLGDILKHAALVEIAAMLAARGSVRFVDTHAFLLHAAPSDPERWGREIDDLVARHPAYARYAALERQSMARCGHYRCSAGLTLDVLGDRRAGAVLGEADGATRAELREQIAAEDLADVVVVDDAAIVDRAVAAVAASLLVHVDPFSLSLRDWAAIAPALDAISARPSEAIVFVVYRYSRNARTPWPAPPRGTSGPVAETRGGPHELAAYASSAITEQVRAVCSALGWRAT